MASDSVWGLKMSQWKLYNAGHASEALSIATFSQGEGTESCEREGGGGEGEYRKKEEKKQNKLKKYSLR